MSKQCAREKQFCFLDFSTHIATRHPNKFSTNNSLSNTPIGSRMYTHVTTLVMLFEKPSVHAPYVKKLDLFLFFFQPKYFSSHIFYI